MSVPISPQRPRRGLVRALRALILASLILPAGILMVVAYADWRQLHAVAEQRAQKTAIILREHALKVFETHELILDRLDDRTRGMDWEEIGRSAELNAFLSALADRHDHVSSLFLIMPTGQLATTSRQFPIASPVNTSDRSYFQVHSTAPTSQTFIAEPITGRVSGEPIMNVSRRREGANGEFDGVVAIGLLLDYFNRFYASMNAEGADSVTLARADGTVLVREPPVVTGVDRLSSESGLMRSIARADAGFYETISELDGIRRLHAFEKVGAYPVFVSYGTSLTAIRQDWLEHLKIQGLFAALASIGLATVGGIALRRARLEEAAVERWRLEAVERERAERLYRGLYNKAPIPQHSLDENGAVLNVSDTWLELLGYEREEVVGRRLIEFLPPDQHAIFEESRTRLLEGGTLRDVPLDVSRRSGERVPMLWSGGVERDADGRFVKTYGALVDITERRRVEKALAQLQKMEAVGQLVAGVAHDFNNLLQALSGCLQMIDRRVSEPRLKTILGTGQQAIDRGAKLTQQLMAFARREALRPEAVAVSDQVLAMSELLTQALREDIELEVRLDRSLWPVLVDPTQFEVAVLNLAVNARDAMPEGGTLRIAGENRVFGPGEREDGLVGEFVRLSVSDTGTGIAPEVLERVFDPFFTTKETGRGSGLGLSQVYGFARQSGGSAEIRSEMGRGTTINLLLPRAEAAPIAARGMDRHHDAIEGIEILLVEDDPIVATMVAAALEDLGCVVHPTANGAEALEALQSGIGIDVLFSDIVMPGLDGVDLAEEARILRPDLSVILTTGYSESRAKVAGIRILEKPYRMETLARALREELAGRR